MRPDPNERDYIERLRRVDVVPVLRPLMLGAADEIERLRAALKDIVLIEGRYLTGPEKLDHAIRIAKRALEQEQTK